MIIPLRMEKIVSSIKNHYDDKNFNILDEQEMYDEIDKQKYKKKINKRNTKLNKFIQDLDKIKKEHYVNMNDLLKIYRKFSEIKNKFTNYHNELSRTLIGKTNDNFTNVPIIYLKIVEINELICQLGLVFESKGVAVIF